MVEEATSAAYFANADAEILHFYSGAPPASILDSYTFSDEEQKAASGIPWPARADVATTHGHMPPTFLMPRLILRLLFIEARVTCLSTPRFMMRRLFQRTSRRTPRTTTTLRAKEAF